MRAGTPLREFATKDGRNAVLRLLAWSDVDDILELDNSLVDEGAEIGLDAKTTREAEIDRLAGLLVTIEKDSAATVVAEIDGKVVGLSGVNTRTRHQRHVGTVGVMIRREYRNVGIGTELLREVDSQAKRLRLEVLTLEVSATNEVARHVYEKAGYRAVGRVPKAYLRGGEKVDLFTMAKELSLG